MNPVKELAEGVVRNCRLQGDFSSLDAVRSTSVLKEIARLAGVKTNGKSPLKAIKKALAAMINKEKDE